MLGQVQRIAATVLLPIAAVTFGTAGARADAAGGPSPEQALAERYSPVVRISGEQGGCGQGEAYQPVPVDAVLGNHDVALRGPWRGTGVVTIAPTATDLAAGLGTYALDFPGDALSPGCDYADWAGDLQRTHRPTVYAHLTTEAGRPGEIALQYWFFYVYNDFNDKHEGDWEMIQLNFRAADASGALATGPYEVGYSEHEGAERAAWEPGGKLQLIDGTHPVVYPALGSHANYFSAQLYLGHSAAQGVGCDDTLGPSRTLRPDVAVIPQQRADYLRAQPWLGYRGHWGERHPAFNDGPTGPTTKTRWDAPFTWEDETWRDKSFAVPQGGVLGHAATGFFCSAVARGSSALNALMAEPQIVLIVLVVLVATAGWLASRTTWGPANPFRARRRRSWGALVTSALRLYTTHLRTFAGIGLVFVPIGLLTVLVQYLLFDLGGLSPLVDTAGSSNPVVALLVHALGALGALIGMTVVQAATAHAVAEFDEGRRVTAAGALRRTLASGRRLLGALVVFTLVVGVLALTVVGSILGFYLTVRWSLFAQAGMLGDAVAPLRGSLRVTRGHFWRTASVVLFVTVLCLVIGPLVGSVLLFATDSSFAVVNLVSALVDVVVSPFIAITATYLYFDLDVRRQLAERAYGERLALPAEV
jgi:hypothetical protein